MAINWTQIYTKYKGAWIALKDDHHSVIASGKTLKEAIEKAKKAGYENPMMHRVPTQIVPYVGGFSR